MDSPIRPAGAHKSPANRRKPTRGLEPRTPSLRVIERSATSVHEQSRPGTNALQSRAKPSGRSCPLDISRGGRGGRTVDAAVARWVSRARAQTLTCDACFARASGFRTSQRTTAALFADAIAPFAAPQSWKRSSATVAPSAHCRCARRSALSTAEPSAGLEPWRAAISSGRRDRRARQPPREAGHCEHCPGNDASSHFIAFRFAFRPAAADRRR